MKKILFASVMLATSSLTYALNSSQNNQSELPPIINLPYALTIINETDQFIVGLISSPHNQNQWGSDILDDKMIRPQSYHELKVPDTANQCEYDLKILMNSGHVVSKDNMNLCTTNTWHIKEF